MSYDRLIALLLFLIAAVLIAAAARTETGRLILGLLITGGDGS